jgi:hypothetical protein
MGAGLIGAAGGIETMTRHDARAHYSDGLSIAPPAINDLLDIIHVPHDADLGVCRS